MNQLRKYIAVFVSCLLLLATLAGCSTKTPPATDDPAHIQAPDATDDPAHTQAPDATATTGAPDVTQPDTTDPSSTEPPATTAQEIVPDPTIPGTILVKTRYGYLYYQDQWEEFMQVVLTDEGDGVAVYFVAKFEDQSFPLFSLHIGEFEGDPLGQIMDTDGVKHNVFITMEEIDVSGLTEGEQNRLFAMQEEINFIIENLE